jgi:FkbM family methyltransferase
MNKLRVAILGSGNIGTDLLIKVQRSQYLTCVLFVGRNLSSPGMAKAINLGVKVSDESIDGIIKNADVIDLIFDATSAKDAKYHWEIIDKLGKIVIDMTPAKLGALCIPAVNLEDIIKENNLDYIDILKVDIEGSEYDVMPNISDETYLKIGQITIEFHDFIDVNLKIKTENIINKLESLGFNRISKPIRYMNNSDNYDVLFYKK